MLAVTALAAEGVMTLALTVGAVTAAVEGTLRGSSGGHHAGRAKGVGFSK